MMSTSGREFARAACVLALMIVGCRGPNEDSKAPEPVAAKVAAATLPNDRAFNAIWGSGSDVWLAGQGGLLARYDGSAWKLYPGLTQQSLRAIHGTSKDDVWVVGENTVLHWNGTEWSVPVKDAAETFIDVFASAPNAVWVVGHGHTMDRGIVRHWDGTKWQITPSPHALSFWTAWASGPTDVWVAGTATGGKGIVLRGETTRLSSPGWNGGSVRSIWGRAPEDVWVAGYEGGVQHWNGSAWSAPEMPVPARLMSVSGSANDNVWAVGLKGVALHWTGERWTSTQTGTERNLMAVWANADHDVWAVGSEGTLLRWDGSRWSNAPR
jgi:hypothetical protein